MTSLLRREPRHLDFPDWMTRWMEESGLGSSLLPTFGSGIRVEEVSEEGAHVIRAELPGIDPDKDVEIVAGDGMLRISAQRRVEEKTEDQGYVRHELRYGSFTRTLPMAEGASESDISATYTDGMLEIRIPVSEQAKPEPTRVAVSKG